MLVIMIGACIPMNVNWIGNEYVPKQKQWIMVMMIMEWINSWCYNALLHWIRNTRLIVARQSKRDNSLTMHPKATKWKRSARISKMLTVLATTKLSPHRLNQFGTDAYAIGIDNRCTACLLHKMSDFIDTPTRVWLCIKAFGGLIVKEVYQGTLKWTLTDNLGLNHTFMIPDSYYIPHGGTRLLLPQHWAKIQARQTHKSRTAWCTTDKDVISLHWNKVKTLPHDHTRRRIECRDRQISRWILAI
jgi:hypothetical protein